VTGRPALLSPNLFLILILILFTLGAFVPCGAAEDAAKLKEAEKKVDPPKILLGLPLAALTGATNALQWRGLNLTNVSELRLSNAIPGATLRVTSLAKVDVPKEYEAKRIGDTRVEAYLFIPTNAWLATVRPVGTFAMVDTIATNWIIAVTPDGASEPFPLLLLPGATVTMETEPNGGFKQAQSLARGGFVLGTIKEPGDVDAYRLAMKAGQELTARVYAEAGQSPLDSLLTLFDEKGHALAVNDDDEGTKDAGLVYRAKRDAMVVLAVQDANDKGGLAHAYVLSVKVKRAQKVKAGR
jgi:hypothetical protein